MRAICNATRIHRKIFQLKSSAVLSTIAHHHDPKSSTPLIEHYRSSWPDALSERTVASLPALPKRTVPDDALKFHFTAHFKSGGALFYPHLKTNPADFKVALTVSQKELNGITNNTIINF